MQADQVDRRQPGAGWAGMLGTAVAVGIGVGVATVIAQGMLPGDWNALANSGAVWTVPAFAVGARARRDGWAAIAGALTLAAAVVGYYAALPVFVAEAAARSSTVAIWIGTAVVGGPLAGLGGRWWRAERGWRSAAGIAVVAGVLVGEGIRRVAQVEMPAAGWGLIVAGEVSIAALGRSPGTVLRAIALAIPVALGTVAAYSFIDDLFRGH